MTECANCQSDRTVHHELSNQVICLECRHAWTINNEGVWVITGPEHTDWEIVNADEDTVTLV